MISNSSNHPVRIFVDADSCPVLDELTRAAEIFGIPVILVTSLAHYGEKPASLSEVVYVDNISQAADMEIFRRVQENDVVVTGDYGLAGLVLAKRAKCLSPRGRIFTQDNIEILLAERHLGSKVRRGGGRMKGPKPFTRADRERFYAKLCQLIEGTQKKSGTPIS